jgi:hypothetical protein
MKGETGMKNRITAKEIVVNYLKQNGFDGLHNHWENQKYGGCGCLIKDYQKKGCNEGTHCFLCEPAYKHTKAECKKCPDYIKCEAYQNGEKTMLCGKKKV